MRVFKDDLERLVWVRWYFVPPDRERVPMPTPFFARGPQVDLGDAVGELGEVGPRSWYRGGIRGGDGTHFCGTDDQWKYGCLTTDPVPALVDGLPACCAGEPVRELVIDAGAGGELEPQDIETADPGCPLCPDSPIHYRVTVSGGTGDWAAANGVFTATRISVCTWTWDGPALACAATFQSPGFNYADGGVTGLNIVVRIANYNWAKQHATCGTELITPTLAARVPPCVMSGTRPDVLIEPLP